MSRRKVYDCFLFYNELDLLNYRLHLLDNVVDTFVLVESTHTFVGKPKPLYYAENREKFKEFADKIVHVVVDDMPYLETTRNNNQWKNEYHQRNSIVRGIANANKDDMIILSDVDEIPNPKIIADLTKSGVYMVKLLQKFHYYNLNTYIKSPWILPTVVSYSLLCGDKTVEELRQIKSVPIIQDGGWHLSYFGSPEFISNKLSNFSHQEYNNPKYNSTEKIAQKIKNAEDLYSRADHKLEYTDSHAEFPPMYDVYLRGYYV